MGYLTRQKAQHVNRLLKETETPNAELIIRKGFHRRNDAGVKYDGGLSLVAVRPHAATIGAYELHHGR